ncbi:zinc-binding dehydrogenase [Ilumatobacter sp.]|jgi:S-(hydroxymethyl)glutathione dehydrogenase/alcohol dehydrogenase|uniref:zinc-binding dehydrogenase n=1 Tax=Ilumatobacter sp. TaxID=1967498 RepID=UPI003098A65B
MGVSTRPDGALTMKAAVCREFGAPLVIEELLIDPPKRDEVLVDIHAVAICASDLHANDGSWGGALPAVNGHEASGVIAAVGPGVESVAVGDRVVISLLRNCRDCFFCSRHETHLCERRGGFAIATEHRLHDADGNDVIQGVYTGAFAERTVVHHSQVARIDDSMGFDVASLLACGVITGFGAVTNTADVAAGSSVVVVGAGGVGLNSIQGARVAGASSVIAVDVSDQKLDDAKEFGATDVVRGDQVDVGEAVAALTGGRGADYVFVTVGSTAAIEQAIGIARQGGTVVVVGMTRTGDVVSIDGSGFAGDGKRVIGSFMGSTDLARDLPRLSQLYADGDLHLDQLITTTYTLDHINEAIASTRSGQARRNVIIIEHPTAPR